MVHKSSIVYFIELLIVVAYIIVCILVGKNFTNNIESNKSIDFNKNWYYYDNDGKKIDVITPNEIDLNPGKTLTLYNELPEFFCENTTLAFYTIHQWSSVYVDDKEIYSFGINSKYNLRTPGNHWNFAEIPAGNDNKIISVELRSEYASNSGIIPSFELGNKSHIITKLLLDRYPDLMLSSFLFICGILFIIIFFASYKYRGVKLNTLYLGFFSIALASWMATETQMLPIMFGNSYAISQFAFFTTILTIYPFMQYIRTTFTFKPFEDKLIFHGGIGGEILLLFNLALQIFDIKDLKEVNILVHLYIGIWLAILVVIIIIGAVKKVKQGIKIRISYIIAVVIVSIPVFSEIFRYNFGYVSRINNSVFNSKMLSVLVISILGIDSLKSSIALIREGRNAEQIRVIAYTDTLTKVRNRTAFDAVMNEISEDSYDEYSIVVLDLNNLKYFNDEFGHETGDMYIISCCELMKKEFEKYGEVFRTGGDEFTVIASTLTDDEFASIIQNIEYSVSLLNNPAYKKQMGISLGYCNYDRYVDHNLYSTMKRADNEMYIYKNKIKTENL